jgi:uncharacterized protein YkwD
MSRSLSRLTVLVLVVAAAATAAGSAAAARAGDRGVSAAAFEAPTVAAINAARREHGLRPLKVSDELDASAAVQSEAMGEGGFCSHDSADGSDFSKRIARFYASRGFSRWTVGENILWASTAVTPTQALRMWLGSPRHRKILLDPTWTEIGLAAVHVSNAPGVYRGRDVTIVTADFGARN